MNTRIYAGVMCGLLLWASGLVQAVADEALIAQLAAEDYEARQTATDALRLDDSLTTEQLAAWYAEAAQPEVRQRLISVARHHFLQDMAEESFPDEGPGLIGMVKSNPMIIPPPLDADPANRRNQPAQTYSLVTQVLDGFPASGRLRPLDRVMAIDGQTFAGGAQNANFEQLMLQYQAGDTLTLTVVRNGEPLDIELTLGNGNALNAMYASPNFGLAPEINTAWVQHQQEHFPAANNNVAPPATDHP
ncbi:MAG: PDZ domain-containing protein [Planctomycetota bacterium]